LDWHSYWVFVGLSVALVIVPGPDMAYMIGRTIAQGRKAGVISVLGINAGAYVHLIAAVTGLSAVLMTSVLAFSIVKLLGAAYLIVLGFQTVLGAGKGDKAGPNLQGVSMRDVFWQGFLSDALNPKVAIFYLAFLPQFVDPHATKPFLQIFLLGLTTNMVALPINILLVMASSSLTGRLRHNKQIASFMQRGLGLTFIGLGARLAIEKR